MNKSSPSDTGIDARNLVLRTSALQPMSLSLSIYYLQGTAYPTYPAYPVRHLYLLVLYNSGRVSDARFAHILIG